MNGKGNPSQDWPYRDPVVTAPSLIGLSPLITHISDLIFPSLAYHSYRQHHQLGPSPWARTQNLSPEPRTQNPYFHSTWIAVMAKAMKPTLTIFISFPSSLLTQVPLWTPWSCSLLPKPPRASSLAESQTLIHLPHLLMFSASDSVQACVAFLSQAEFLDSTLGQWERWGGGGGRDQGREGEKKSIMLAHWTWSPCRSQTSVQSSGLSRAVLVLVQVLG